MAEPLTREDIKRICREAREQGRIPDLSGANLYGADLSGANFYGADLRGANLSRANLYGANLRGVNIEETKLPHFQIPDGTLIAWGKKAGKLVKYEIPAAAKRTACLINRKCRAEYALVLEIEGGLTEITVNRHPYPLLTYRVGEIAHPDSYDPNPTVDCSHGIHVFMTREEAEEWNL